MVLPVVEVKITADPTSAKKGLKDVSAAILAADRATAVYTKGQQQKKCATGLTTMVHFDYQTKQAVAINDEIKAALLANYYSE